MYNKDMRKKITKENYASMRRKGKQNVRVMLILFYMFLLCYAVLGYFIVDMLFMKAYPDAIFIYLVKTISMLMIWLFLIRIMWRFRKIGRTLFSIGAICSLYSLYDMKLMLDVSFPIQSDQVLNYLYAALIGCKTIIILSCMLKMRCDPFMRCIWSAYIIYEDALDEEEEEEDEEEEPLQELPFQHHDAIPLILRLPQTSPLVLKAKKHIRINAFLFSALTFGGFLFFYVFMIFMQMNDRHDIGIAYVQRQVILSTLFSILIWMFPIIMMFFYHRFTKVLLFLAWLCEAIRQTMTIPMIIETFMSQHYTWKAAMILIGIELCRYLCFYKLTLRVVRDPFIHTYWSKQFRTKEPYE